MAAKITSSRVLARALLSVCSVTVLGMLFACSGAGTSAVTSQPSGTTKAPQTLPADTTSDPSPSETTSAPSENTPAPSKSRAIPPQVLQAAIEGRIPALSANQITLGSFGEIIGGGRIISTPQPNTLQLMLDDGISAFLRGVNTSNLVNGNEIALGRVLCVGKTEYTSALGVPMSGWDLEIVSDSEWVEAIAKAKQLDAEQKRGELRAEIDDLQSKLDSLPFYEWKDKSGSFTVKAQFVEMNETTVSIKREDDGRVIEVPLDRLDEATLAKAKNRAGDVARWKARQKQLERLLEKN